MENPETIKNIDSELPQQESLVLENSHKLTDNSLISNDNSADTLEQNSNSENQTSIEKSDVITQNENDAHENNSVVPVDNPVPPLPKDDKEPQASAPYSADYNTQNYANYNYMYGNYNNYYGYPYPQYQWDYNTGQYYQPYQNYYNYNYNTNQVQTQASSKPPPPPPDTVQLPVEEKPVNKMNPIIVDDSNRYSPTVETDDDDTMKGLSDNIKPNTLTEQTTIPLSNVVSLANIENQQNISESTDLKIQHPVVPSNSLIQQSVVPVIAQLQQYNIPVQQPSYLINPQGQIQSTEAVNEVTNQQQSSPTLNGKDDSTEKVSKGCTVLGKSQAKKRLMAFSMMKQKLQEQNSSNDNQSADIVEGNDVEFVPELNVFQTVPRKKVNTNKKATKVIKAQQTIEQIEEMKKDEMLQGSNAALYQHLLRSGGNEAPILQKLGIESLAEKYSAKIREQDKRFKRHQHRRRDDSRRGHKYRRRSHSKSRSRSRSTEKPKMRALNVKSWKDFVSGGFHFDKYRKFKFDEVEEMKDKERKSRIKKRHGDSRSDGKIQTSESLISSTEAEKGNGDQKSRYNILDQKKEILKGVEVLRHGDFTIDFPSYIIKHTKSKPVVKFSHNPSQVTYHLQNRQQMLATLLPEIELIVHKFFLSMKPKKLKENHTNHNYNYVDDKILAMMKNKMIYPFKGWWPKAYFIVTQVKEDPNVEIDKDALINEFTTTKRIKKSRFNDDISMTDLRPTVPSKWDSDYDGSPIADKVADIDISQNIEININNSISKVENNPADISFQEKTMDTTSDTVIHEPDNDVNVCPILPTLHEEIQEHSKLNTEYEEFLKIVSVEKTLKNNVPINIDLQDKETSPSIKSISINDESVQDESEDETSTKSSDGSNSLNNVEESSFIKNLSSVDKKLKKKKKKSYIKKSKKKESKKKKRKTSESESSQNSESENDSSSEDSESETSDSTSSFEIKKKKKRSKDKKKKKSKSTYKKKHKGDKSKTKDNNILNLLEKAFNVEIKKRSLDDELKSKKKKQKHEKKDIKSTDENDEKFEKVRECLKETFTKFVKTENVHLNQSVSCDENTVNDVLKYFKINEKKEKKKKKSKKSLKRKFDSDYSENDEILKKARFDNNLLLEDTSEKKKKSKKKKSEKKFIDSDEQSFKKKSKKKSKTSDTSETEEGMGSTHKNSKTENDSNNFFGLRPNDWIINNNNSTRGVVHHSAVKNICDTLTPNVHKLSDVRIIKSESLHLIDTNVMTTADNEISIIEKHDLPNIFEDEQKKNIDQLYVPDENITNSNNKVSKHISEKKIMINLKNSDCESDDKEHNIENDKNVQILDQCDNNVIKCKSKIQQTVLSPKDKYEQQDLFKDLDTVLKPNIIRTPTIGDKPPITILKPLVPIINSISHRDKVKMNLKKLSTCQHIPFVFGYSSQHSTMKPTNFNIENLKAKFEKTKIEVKLQEDNLKLLKLNDSSKVVHSPQALNKIPDLKNSTIPPENNTEPDNIVLNQSFNSWEDSEDSISVQSSVISNNTPESLSDEEENYILRKNNENKTLYYSNAFNVLDHKFDTTESSSGSIADIEEQIFQSDSDIENNVDDEMTTSLNASDLSKTAQNFELNTVESQDTESYECILPNSHNSSNDMEFSLIDNELVNQWTSDWSKLLDESNYNSVNYNHEGSIKLKKKSRWDEPPKNDKREFITNLSGNTSPISSSDIECCTEQNQTCEIASINSVNNSVEYDCYSDNWVNEYESYNQYSCQPQYSEMKTLKDSQLSPVDYSIYENYNPDYDYQGEDYDKWKSLDTTHELIIIPTTDETISNEQNLTEDISNQDAESEESNKQIELDSSIQDNIVKIEIPDSVDCDEQFYELYQQHFKHFNQNPIKYSMSDPILDIKPEFNLNASIEKLSPQEKLSDLDKEVDLKTIPIPIPLRDRAYACLIEDDNCKVYLTNDNYIAYCAVEDKCMVHIAVKTSSRDGIEDEVRHCFNINHNGSYAEYWLHANLIPFYNPSESGVLSDDEEVSIGSDSGLEDNVEEDDDGNDIENYTNNDVVGEWELVDNIHEDKDKWLNNSTVIEKYGDSNIERMAQTVVDINQEENVSNSSESDTDENDFSEFHSKKYLSQKKNILVSPFQNSLEITDNKNEIQSILTTSNKIINLPDRSKILNTESLITDNTSAEVIDDLISEIKSENNDETFKKLDEKQNINKLDVPHKEEMSIEELKIMNTIINQQMLIQRLKIRAKEKIQEKLPDTEMVRYSDNTETIKHPFLGLFQPPTISILLKEPRVKEAGVLRFIKHVTFADGINPGVNSAASPTHDDSGRPLSPTPLKALMRESLRLKRNMYPFKRSKVRQKLIMVNKKVAKVTPLIKSASAAAVNYYISHRPLDNVDTTETTSNNSGEGFDDSSSNSDCEQPSRPAKEVTPVPSDIEGWSDDDVS